MLARELAPRFGKAAGSQVKPSDIDLTEWKELVEIMLPLLKEAADEAATNALATLSIDEAGMFDQVAALALEWAKQRAAEMVGMKWVDGELVDNPDPRWAITDSTRDGLRDLISQAFEDGMGQADLEKEIVNSYLFSEQRAEMIARTEIAQAHIQGTIKGWKVSDLVAGYSWILGSEHDVPDECDDNADSPMVELGKEFPSGDLGPPAHPNCICALSPVLKSEIGG